MVKDVEKNHNDCGKCPMGSDPKAELKDLHLYDLNWCNCKVCKLRGTYAWCDEETKGTESGCPYGSINLMA